MEKKPKNIPSPYNFPGTPIFRDTTALPFAAGGPLNDRDINGNLLNSTYASPLGNMFKYGGFGEDQGTFDYARSNYASSPGNSYKDGGQFQGNYSLPEDSYRQGGNNLHDSVYASSPQQYPAVYNFGGNLDDRQQMYMPLDHVTRNGGSILSMSNTPQMEGEGKDLVYEGGGQLYTYAGRPGAKYQKDLQGNWLINTNEGKEFTPIKDPTGKRAALLNKQATVYRDPNKYKKTYDPLLGNPPIAADNTRTVVADEALAAVQNAAYMKSPEYKAKQKAEKEAQAKFEKEQWANYNKMSLGEKVLDRTNAALNQPLLMASNALMGEQAYIPGMAEGLGGEGIDYDKYLKATGQERGLGVNDVFNAVNPGNWGGHAGREYGEGNYATGAAELGLGLLGLKGAPMGEEIAKKYADKLINLEQKVGTKQIVPDFSNLTLPRLPGVPSAAPKNLEEIRRAYHTGARILRPNEQTALTVYGAGNAANYRTIDFSRFPAASTGVSNTVIGTEIPAFLRRGLTDFSNPAQNAQRINNITAQRGVNVTPFNSQGINSIGELENSLENWFQTNRLDSELLEDVFTSKVNNVRGRYNLGNNLESELTDVVRGLSPEQKTNFLNDLSTELTNLSPDELFMMRSNYGTRNLGNVSNTKKYGNVNKSGLNKEEVAKQTTKEGKDTLNKMSEEEFANTVLTPSGEILPYTSKQAEAVADIPTQEYTEIFNKDLKRLNEIIAEKNKSGVPYEVEKLDPSGRLTFKTPERTVPRDLSDADKSVLQQSEAGLKNAETEYNYMLKNNMFADENEANLFLEGINQQKTYYQNLKNRLGTEVIPEGTKSWGVGIKPGKWEGEVENIPSQEYYKSIPGLSISNSMSGVFADGVVRRGSGAYDAVNDYLKELNLGRVKPGFNSQTSYSKGLWENAVSKGKAMGYYGNPSVVYGSMKSLVPYIGVGGAAAGSTLLANPWQEKPKGL